MTTISSGLIFLDDYSLSLTSEFYNRRKKITSKARKRKPKKGKGIQRVQEDYYTESGYPKIKGTTEKHDENWVYYVTKQYSIILDELVKTKKVNYETVPYQITSSYYEALNKAKQLDKLTASDDDTMKTTDSNLYQTSIKEPQEIAKIINWWREFAKHNESTKTGSSNPPTWGPIVDGGMGSWVKAEFSKNTTYAAGSGASGTKTYLPWNDKYLTHRGKSLEKSKTIYVRGHLLNDHLGGHSAPYNLVPLTGEATAGGTENANKVHEGAIESLAKKAVEEMYKKRDAEVPSSPSLEDIEKVTYSVKAVWEKRERESTKKVKVCLDNFNTILETLNKRPRSKTGKESSYTVWVLEQFTKQKYPKVWSNNLKDGINAVVPEKFKKSVKAETAKKVMQENYKLCKYEDKHVPKRLECELKIERTKGEDPPKKESINISIPNTARAPYVKSEITKRKK